MRRERLGWAVTGWALKAVLYWPASTRVRQVSLLWGRVISRRCILVDGTEQQENRKESSVTLGSADRCRGALGFGGHRGQGQDSGEETAKN